MIVPSGIATDDTTKFFFHDLMQHERLVSLLDFRNWQNLFPGIGYHERFALVTFSGYGSISATMKFAFYCENAEDIKNEDSVYSISLEQIKQMNPNSGKLPIIPEKHDRKLMLLTFSRFPVFVDQQAQRNDWNLDYIRLFDMSAASEHFHTKEELLRDGYNLLPTMHFKAPNSADRTFLPFYEGKYIQIYDHRFSSFENVPVDKRFGRKPGTHTPTTKQKQNPNYSIEPRYWMAI